jgi:DNA anti-recombination protein RmuC
MSLLTVVIGAALGTIVGAVIATVILRAGARREREEARTRMSDTIRAAAADALHDNSSVFVNLAKSSLESLQKDAQAQLQTRHVAIDTLVRPMADTLKKVEARLRPDVVVHLPGGKQFVVDAKAPLDAFLDAQDAVDDASRATRLLAHARQVRDHMDKLGNKSYWDALGNSPEMVVMFLPGETLFSAALQHDLTLIEYGLERRVLLASPITLIALLTTVAHSWRQDALTENYREVARLGKELHDRLGTFVSHFDDVRRKLDGAVQAYNSAAGSLESRVLVTARRLKELDITTSSELQAAEPVDTAPRVLRQVGLMGLPEGAVTEESEPV